ALMGSSLFSFLKVTNRNSDENTKSSTIQMRDYRAIKKKAAKNGRAQNDSKDISKRLVPNTHVKSEINHSIISIMRTKAAAFY
ncbi:hypothetical protein NB572_06035, partial [Vibrio alginolyticus]|nr:hypothetical protein [Vibrio alginolyticus]